MDDDAKDVEQLLEERTQDLVYTKIRLKEEKRTSGRLFAYAVIISIIVLGCLACFACSVYFITKEQTKQLQAIFDSDFVVTHERSAEHIYQDAGSGNAIMTNNSTVTNSSIIAKTSGE